MYQKVKLCYLGSQIEQQNAPEFLMFQTFIEVAELSDSSHRSSGLGNVSFCSYFFCKCKLKWIFFLKGMFGEDAFLGRRATLKNYWVSLELV